MNTSITVTIGPNDWALSYTFADFAEAERRLKRHLLPGSQRSIAEWEGMTPTEDLAVSIFIGICRANPPLRLENVYDAITFENMTDLGDKVTAAMSRDTKPLRDRAAKAAAEGSENPTATT